MQSYTVDEWYPGCRPRLTLHLLGVQEASRKTAAEIIGQKEKASTKGQHRESNASCSTDELVLWC